MAIPSQHRTFHCSGKSDSTKISLPAFQSMSPVHELAASGRHERHSSLPWAGRSTVIRIECSAVYTLRCIFMARMVYVAEHFMPGVPTGPRAGRAAAARRRWGTGATASRSGRRGGRWYTRGASCWARPRCSGPSGPPAGPTPPGPRDLVILATHGDCRPGVPANAAAAAARAGCGRAGASGSATRADRTRSVRGARIIISVDLRAQGREL